MLAWEEAGARLSAVADQHWLRSARQRVGRLESELQSLAEPLLEPRTWSLHGEQQRKLSEAATGLDELGGEQLRSVMDALHPQLGPSLAAWWKAAVSQPFGWGPGAFRAPSDPALTRDRRIRDLKDLVGTAGPHAEPLEWFAAWAPYLSVPDRFVVEPVDIGPLLAAGIDAGGPVGEATFRTLIDSATGEHPIGGMGSHVIVGLLRSSRTGGWEFIESMLLTAQRQEGLRQSILEAAGGAHPDAFTRIIDLISSEDLIRFAATISAVSAWLGFPEHAERLDDAERRLRLLQAYRTDRGLAARQVIEGEAWDTYVGLCATAQHDVLPALDLAREALRLADRDNRAAALRFLVYSGLPIEYLLPSFVAAMADPDLGVASMAHRALVWNGYRPEASDGELYGALDDLARRLPEKTRRAEPVGIDPDPVPLDRGAVVATMTAVLGDRPLEPLLAHLPSMDPATRGALARKAGERGKLDGDLRRAVVKLVGDRSSMVRKCAVEAMEGLQVDAAEALELEPLLTRRAGDLRRGVIGLLGRLPVSDALDSSRRLWNGSELQRDAACELLSTLDRRPAVVATAQGFLADGASETQQAFLALVVGEKQSGVDDRTLGLFTPDEMTAPHPPHTGPEGRRFSDPAAFRILGELDDLAESHRNTVLELVTWQDSTEVLLADATWLPGAFHRNRAWAGELDWGMVLPEVFRGWWDNRPADCRGESEALDALRALVVSQLCVDHEDPSFIRGRRSPVRELLRPLVGPDLLQLRHPGVVRHVLEWLLVEAADQSVIDECMDATEVALASIPGTWLQRLTESVDEGRRYEVEWRGGFVQLCPWITLTQNLLIGKPSLMT
ncbi:MAG TPA: hypothetical protein ENI86_00480, partial [Acidimicrobiales bacterium]|nr:hypothetical protein [Acidimicrobiales bacterium]